MAPRHPTGLQCNSLCARTHPPKLRIQSRRRPRREFRHPDKRKSLRSPNNRGNHGGEISRTGTGEVPCATGPVAEAVLPQPVTFRTVTSIPFVAVSVALTNTCRKPTIVTLVDPPGMSGGPVFLS